MPIQVFVISRLLDLHSMSADLKILVIALSSNILIERLLTAYSVHVDGLLELDLDYGLSFELINDISEMELQNFESPKTREWNETDSLYWKNKGWLNNNRPWK